MRRWAPWLLAFIVWNGTFDLQVRRAGEAFTSAQLARWRAGERPALLRDVLGPEVRAAAWRSSGLATVVLLLSLGVARRAAPVRLR